MVSKGVYHGTYPWNQPVKAVRHSDSSVYYGCDTKEQIAMCMGCTREKCINCLEKKQTYYKPQTNRADKQCRMRKQFRRLWEEGRKAKQICEEMNIGTSTYYRYLRYCTQEGAM